MAQRSAGISHPPRRSRMGCFNCRERKVKCDETHPICRRCSAFGHRCKGYSPVTERPWKSKTMSLPHGLDSPCQDISEYSNPGHTRYFIPGFWNDMLRRMRGQKKVIRLSLDALSLAHTAYASQDQQDHLQAVIKYQDALQSYALAMKSAANVSGYVYTEVLIVTCYLFVCIETLIGSFGTATQHAQAGLRYYVQWRDGDDHGNHLQQASSTNPAYCIWRAATEFEAMFGDSDRDPVPLLEHNDIQVDPFFQDCYENITKFDEVHGILTALRKRACKLRRELAQRNLRKASVIPPEYLEQHQQFGKLLVNFDPVYQRFAHKFCRSSRESLLLQLRYAIIRALHEDQFSWCNREALQAIFGFILQTCRLLASHLPSAQSLTLHQEDRSSQHAVDSLTKGSVTSRTYERKHPTLLMEADVIPGLFLVATSGTVLSERWDAIELLRSLNTVEGIWTSNKAATLAQQLLQNEVAGIPFANYTVKDIANGTLRQTQRRQTQDTA